MAMLRTLRGGITSILAALTLTACVAGQSIDFKYAADPATTVAAGQRISVIVDDQRPYVTNKDKDPAFIGHYRAGFGNMWTVTTVNDRPLSQVMQDDLTMALTAQGFKTAAAGKGVKAIKVTILDWNFDTYINGKFWYELAVEVTGTDGRQMAKQVLKDKVTIEGSMLTGARFAFEDEMPKIYGKIMRQITRTDPALARAISAR
jgi:hypothetical protein